MQALLEIFSQNEEPIQLDKEEAVDASRHEVIDDFVFRQQLARVEAIDLMSVDPTALRGLDETLRHDRDIVLAAVRKNGHALGLAPEEFRGDRELVLEAIKHQPASISSAARELRMDLEFLVAAARLNDGVLRYAPPQILGKARAKLRHEKLLVATGVQSQALGLSCTDIPLDIPKEGAPSVDLRENLNPMPDAHVEAIQKDSPGPGIAAAMKKRRSVTFGKERKGALFRRPDSSWNLAESMRLAPAA